MAASNVLLESRPSVLKSGNGGRGVGGGVGFLTGKAETSRSRAVLCRRRKVPLLMAHCTDSRLSEALTRADDQLGPRPLRADSDDWAGSKAQG